MASSPQAPTYAASNARARLELPASSISIVRKGTSLATSLEAEALVELDAIDDVDLGGETVNVLEPEVAMTITDPSVTPACSKETLAAAHELVSVV